MPLTAPPAAPPAAPDAAPAVPSRAVPSTFRALADAFVSWEVTFRNSIADLRTWLAGFIGWAATHVAEMQVLQDDVDATALALRLQYVKYTFSTTTADADPGAGALRLNGATQNSATAAFLDLLADGGGDVTGLLDSFGNSSSSIKGDLLIAHRDTPSTKWLRFAVTAANTRTGYRALSLIPTGSSAANPFANGDQLDISFVRTGDASIIGDDGTLSFRNRLHNGSFRINQRAVSGTVTLAAGAYGFDRWKAGASGCTFTFAASGNRTIVTITAGSLVQVIEGSDVEGGFYVLTNQGTAQARIAVNGAATSGSYASSAYLLSAAATGGQNITVEFSTGTIDRVQLEPGTTQTRFERRPISVELALCQRFYETGITRWDGYAQTAVLYTAPVTYKVTKRTLPTLTLTNLGATTVGTTTAVQNPGVDGHSDARTSVGTGNAAWQTAWIASADL